jgi:cyclase
MLAKRIIPCLDVNNGRVVKGVNFVGLRDAGDPVELAARYNAEGADELVFLDIGATIEGRQTLINVVEQTAREVFIPLTVGGGVRSVDDARAIIRAGADKISVNSAAVNRPELLRELSDEFGSHAEQLDALEWAQRGEQLGAGEILLTSMDADGVKTGFDLPLTSAIHNCVQLPVIASGGAGTLQHFVDVLQHSDAALAASVFHFGTLRIDDVKSCLRSAGMVVRS